MQRILPLFLAITLAGCQAFDTKGDARYRIAQNPNSTKSRIVSSTVNVGLTSTLRVFIANSAGSGIIDLVPTLSIAPATGVTINSCSATDPYGYSTCTFSVTTVGSYVPTVSSPVSITGSAFSAVQGLGSVGFSTQPSSTGTAGSVLATNPVAQVRDHVGNGITGAAGQHTVTLSLTGSDATAVLSVNGVNCPCTGTNDASGNVTFTNTRISKPGLYNLNVTSGAVSGQSNSVTISSTVGTQLSFTTQPSNSTANFWLPTSPAIQILDALGNQVTTGPDSNVNITLSLVGCGGGTLVGNSTVAAAGGAVSFSSALAYLRILAGANIIGCRIQAAATLSSGAVTALSNTFDITAPGARSGMYYVLQPSSTAASSTSLSNQPQIAVVDASGNIIASDNFTTITVSKAAGSSSGTLLGTNTAVTTNGVAYFSGLNFDAAGSYAITATSSGLTAANSASITVGGVATATRLEFSQQPSTSGTAPNTLNTVVVRAVDAGGTVDASFTGTITITLTTGTGTIGGTTSLAATAGVATFSGLTVSQPGIGKQLTASASALTSTTSNTFDVYNVSSGRSLRFSSYPTVRMISGQAYAGTFAQVEVVDERGIRVTTDNTSNITLGCSSGCATFTSTAGLTKTVASGVATFTDITATVAATNYNAVISATHPVYNAAASAYNTSIQLISAASGTGSFTLFQNPTAAAVNDGIAVVTILDNNGRPAIGVTPVTAAMTAGPGVMTITCGTTNTAGQSTCTFGGTLSGAYTMQLTAPVLAAPPSLGVTVP